MYPEESPAGDRQSPAPSPARQMLFSATAALVLINVLIFFRTDISDLMGQENTWISRGAISWQAFFLQHEYYRLLTSMFLHSGIDHIANNMIVLFFLGSYLEQRTGSRRFLVLYFFSGLLAGCASMGYNMMQNAYAEAVGASGAIFGVMGALLIFSLLHRGEPGALNVRQLLFSIFLAIESGLADQHVDNAAHIGGFLAGALIMLASEYFLIKKRAAR